MPLSLLEEQVPFQNGCVHYWFGMVWRHMVGRRFRTSAAFLVFLCEDPMSGDTTAASSVSFLLNKRR